MAFSTIATLVQPRTAIAAPFLPRLPGNLKRVGVRSLPGRRMAPLRVAAASLPDLTVLRGALVDLIGTSPPTWRSAVFSNLLIFVVGSPLVLAGLSGSGIVAAFLLGTLTWRAFGASGFLLVATYFIIVSAVFSCLIFRLDRQH